MHINMKKKKENKDRKGKEIGKRKVRSGYSRSVPVIESIPVHSGF